MLPTLPKAGEALPLVRAMGHCPDPVALYEALTDGGQTPDTLLLESGETSTPYGEKSLLAVRCALRLACTGRSVAIESLSPNGESLLPWLEGELARRAEPRRVEGGLVVDYPPPAQGDEEARLAAPSPMDALRAVSFGLRSLGMEASHRPLVAGTLAYDLLGSFEELPEPSRDLTGWPDFEMWLPDRMVWLNHRQRQATIVCQVFGGALAQESYNDAAVAIGRLAAAVATAPPLEERAGAPARVPPELPPAVDQSDEEYGAKVTLLKEHIVAGDVFQIVPSRTFSLPCPTPLDAYRRLRALNPSPYMFFLHGRAGVLFGASPETAIRVDGQPRRLQIRPIAGTRPRGRTEDGRPDADLDSRLEAELRLNAKEVAEHMMLVDLARNDVARVSEPGSRTVDRLLTVERYSHVMHLVSHVSGQLRSDLDALHAYVATMNMGTLVGAPKLMAATLLRRHEPTRRGPYGGAVGYLTADGEMDSAIVIRSAVVVDGVAHVRAGAGVVYDSEPLAEADETRRKAGAVLSAIEASRAAAAGGEA